MAQVASKGDAQNTHIQGVLGGVFVFIFDLHQPGQSVVISENAVDNVIDGLSCLIHVDHPAQPNPFHDILGDTLGRFVTALGRRKFLFYRDFIDVNDFLCRGRRALLLFSGLLEIFRRGLFEEPGGAGKEAFLFFSSLSLFGDFQDTFNIDKITLLLQCMKVFLILNDEALQQKAGFQPGAGQVLRRACPVQDHPREFAFLPGYS